MAEPLCPSCGNPVRFRSDARRSTADGPKTYTHTPRAMPEYGHLLRIDANGNTVFQNLDGTWPVITHFFTGITEDFEHGYVGWRWHCSCGAIGSHRGQSKASTAFAWYDHAFRAMGIKMPHTAPYASWMRQATERDHGLRAADLQRAKAELGLTPQSDLYPWADKPIDAQ